MNRLNILRPSTQVIIFMAVCLMLLACAPAASPLVDPLSFTPTSQPTAIPTTSPSPTLVILSAIEGPTAPPPTPTATPLATPQANFDDLTPYRQAMLPAFTADVDTVAQAGASRYTIEVSLDPASLNDDQDPTLRGLERIRYTNTETVTLSDIYFHLYPNLPAYGGQMTIEAVVVEGQSVKPSLEVENSILRVPLPQPLNPGEVFDLSLFYTAIVPRQTMAGYNVFVFEDNTMALAGFYPAVAVYEDKGWNLKTPPDYGDATYLDVSLYQIKLTVPDTMVVAASGSVLGSQSNPNGSKTLSLASGPMRDFYLAMRQDFAVASATVDGITVNSFYPANLTDGGKLALRYAGDALRVFNRRFGPYPYTELDVVATPTVAGGIEYPGLMVINQQLYQYEGAFFQQVVAHEAAHQWWYGLVGNNQIDEPWLDESLTNYSTIFYWEEVESQSAAQKIIEGYFVDPYQEAKKNGQDMAVLGPVENFSERDYGTFVYGKGPLFFDALRREVGDDTYFKIMQTYAAQYKYKLARGSDLLAIIKQVSGRDITPLVKKWLENGP